MRRKLGRFMTNKNIPVILDLGHHRLKGIVGDDVRRRVSISHALIEKSRDSWESEVSANNYRHSDYIRVGNRYYIVGELADSTAPIKAEGVARYSRGYYGTLMCSVISRLFNPDEIRSAIVFASYPPGDIRHREDLEKSLLGRWEFTNNGNKYQVVVQQVVSYTEPMGGFWSFLLQEDEYGNLYDNPRYNPHAQTLMIDFGGGTLSLLPVGKDQMADFNRAISLDIGFNDVAKIFSDEMRIKYREEFKGVRKLADELAHEAIRTRQFVLGGVRVLDVSDIVERSLMRLFEQFRGAYISLGQGVNFGQVILTGGGSAAVGEHLKMLLGDMTVFYAHDRLEEMEFANVFGGLKAYREIFTPE